MKKKKSHLSKSYLTYLKISLKISNNFITHGKQSGDYLLRGVATGTAFKRSKIYLKCYIIISNIGNWSVTFSIRLV